MEELTIDKEFASLCPDLSPEEFKQLEQNIIDDGCRDPITIWANHGGTILDGHNRYKICRKRQIAFKVRALNLERDAATAWILKNQLGRRNLDTSQRSMLAAKMPTTGRGDESGRANLHDRNVADVAEQFNVSERSVASARKVVANGAAVLQKAVESGDVPVSAAAVIAELPKAEQAKVVAKGPEAVAKKAKQIKEKKPRKAPDFDTAKLDKELAKAKKPGTAKKQWEDSTVIDAIGQYAKQIDAAYGGFIALFDQCHAEAGGSEADLSRAKRAAHQGKAESHKLLDGVTTAFRMWRPKK